MHSRGFTLIEIIIAITILTVGIMACYAAITEVVSLTYFNSFRFTASRLAQEGMELVSNTRDTNWLNGNDWDYGLTSCTLGCEIDYNDSDFSAYQNQYLKIDSNGFYNHDGDGDDSRFKRKITITHISPDEIKVKVQITWTELGSSLGTLEAEEHLYNWR